MRVAKAACLLSLALGALGCGATVQQVRDVTRSLNEQIRGLEEKVVAENQKAVDALKKELLLNRQATEDGALGVTKSRVALEQRIAALESKLADVSSMLVALRRGAQMGGGQSAFAELDVRAIGENHYRVSRRQFTEYTYELGRLAAQIPLVAQFDGDKRVGLRLTDGNGFLGRFGILVGDVLMSVNELELRSPEQTREVFRAVKGAKEVKVGVRRGAERLVIRITVAK